MILATRFTFIFLKKVEKIHFHSKWLDHLLLITSWKLIITELVSKCVQGKNEQLLKKLGADVLSSWKIPTKT